MPVDKEELMRAVDAFSDDDFVVAQEILARQFETAKNEFLKDKLGLENDLSVPEEENDENEEE
jgi:hypothetical protein